MNILEQILIPLVHLSAHLPTQICVLPYVFHENSYHSIAIKLKEFEQIPRHDKIKQRKNLYPDGIYSSTEGFSCESKHTLLHKHKADSPSIIL
jgi:hypothetical protein